ncbi:MAG: extracellular solute-binding protein, partial [bacterium]|nr:extracellular solute-binding protein [bacterium]
MSQRRRIPSVGLFLLALMTCLLTCSLVGCTGRDPGKKIILEVYYDAPLHISDYYLSVFRKFEKDYPYIRIKSERGVANYYAKLQTRMASGTAPDVMYIQNKSLADYRDRGVLLNLKAFINKEKYDLDDIYELGLIEGGISEEQVYGIPVTGAPEVLIYNKRLFDEFSLSYPDERWSWDDLLAASIKLTRDTNGDGRIDQFGISIVPGWWAQDIAWIWSNGGEVFNDKLNKCVVDNRQAGEAIQ